MKKTATTTLVVACLFLSLAADLDAADGVSLQTTARETGDPQPRVNEEDSPPAVVQSATDQPTVQQREVEATRNWWKDNDTDGDGKISAMEAKANAGLDARFAEIDADGDGFVKLREYSDYYQRHVSRDVPTGGGR